LTDLALNGLCSSIKEKLEHYEFLTINKLLQKAIALKTRSKDSCDIHRSCCPNMHATECHLDSSDDETNDYALLNLYGQQKNQSLVHLSSWFTRISKRI
jgi:hypothetical protein